MVVDVWSDDKRVSHVFFHKMEQSCGPELHDAGLDSLRIAFHIG